jgi:DNA-binding HxlR family transcriptional regulator
MRWNDGDMSTTRIDPQTLPGRPCSIAAALDVVGDRWSLLIVREISFGNRRFSQIVRNTGAPRDRVSARLRSLVEAGVLERHVYQDNPRRDEYQLTDAGRDLAKVTTGLLEWGNRWAVTEPPMVLMHHDHQLRSETVCGTCGEPVHRGDVTRKTVAIGWDEAGPR